MGSGVCELGTQSSVGTHTLSTPLPGRGGRDAGGASGSARGRLGERGGEAG